jgi:hypothetical protein
MSKMLFLILCLQLSLVKSSLAAQIDDKVIGRALSEAQREIELKTLSSKTGFNFNSIPGHARFVNSEKYLYIF